MNNSYDIIGDVHGCFSELLELVGRLGYVRGQDSLYRHPTNAQLVFVGDLTDRGPENLAALDFVYRHTVAGLAQCVRGNHDDKLHRALKGNPIKVGEALQKTLQEIEPVFDCLKQIYCTWLGRLPYVLDLDNGRLQVCHAAPPSNPDSKKGQAVALYGRLTGKSDANGFPERLDWVPDYNKEDGCARPFVVFGHVSYQDAYLTKRACGIDTGCYAGNKLSAIRWPSLEIVSVDSKQPKQEQPLAIGGVNVPTYKNVRPKPITDVSLDYLLGELRDNQEEILYLIDTDPLLKKRVHPNGLIIANASKGLFEPEYEHQMFAKGIVYRNAPYELVSLPLVKMHNHGMREVSDKTSQRLVADPDVRFVFPDKLDGTMIQVFEDNGEVFFTTRSVLEGADQNVESDFPFLETARAIAKEKYGLIFEVGALRGRTFIFELIHPGNRIVTDYGDREDLVLLSVFDLEERCYLESRRVEHVASIWNLNMAQPVVHANNLYDGICAVQDKLNGSSSMREGSVVCFEKDGRIVHRVKVKTEDYLKYHRLKFQCSYKNTVKMLWNKPELHDWDLFNQSLREDLLTEQEVESFYRAYFDQFMIWYRGRVRAQLLSMALVQMFRVAYGPIDDHGAFMKALALAHKVGYEGIFRLIMKFARTGELALVESMILDEPYPGFNHMAKQWMREQNEG